MRYLNVECATEGCPAAGRGSRVPLRLVALDVVEWPRLVCSRCGLDLIRRNWPFDGGEDPMPKITAHGGPSNAAVDPPPNEDSALPAALTLPDVPAEPDNKPVKSPDKTADKTESAQATTPAAQDNADDTDPGSDPGKKPTGPADDTAAKKQTAHKRAGTKAKA